MTDEAPTQERNLDTIMDEASVVIAEKLLKAARAGQIDFFAVARELKALNSHIDEQTLKAAANAPKEETKLDGLRQQFHGHAPRVRRTASRKAKGGEGDTAGPAGPSLNGTAA